VRGQVMGTVAEKVMRTKITGRKIWSESTKRKEQLPSGLAGRWSCTG
jgi:hypothetical protein